MFHILWHFFSIFESSFCVFAQTYLVIFGYCFMKSTRIASSTYNSYILWKQWSLLHYMHVSCLCAIIRNGTIYSKVQWQTTLLRCPLSKSVLHHDAVVLVRNVHIDTELVDWIFFMLDMNHCGKIYTFIKLFTIFCNLMR